MIQQRNRLSQVSIPNRYRMAQISAASPVPVPIRAFATRRRADGSCHCCPEPPSLPFRLGSEGTTLRTKRLRGPLTCPEAALALLRRSNCTSSLTCAARHPHGDHQPNAFPPSYQNFCGPRDQPQKNCWLSRRSGPSWHERSSRQTEELRWQTNTRVNEQPFMERHRRSSVIRRGHPKENFMKLVIIAVSAAALIASAPAVLAQGSSAKAPGQEMQKKGSVKGSPGASGYAPGQEMQAKGSKKGTEGASGYAPGQTSGSSTGGMSGPSTTTTKSK